MATTALGLSDPERSDIRERLVQASLDGAEVVFVDYASVEDLKAAEGSHDWQRWMMRRTELARIANETEGLRWRWVRLDPLRYHLWLNGRPNTADRRAEYAANHATDNYRLSLRIARAGAHHAAISWWIYELGKRP